MHPPSLCVAWLLAGMVLTFATEGFCQDVLPPNSSVPMPADPPTPIPQENPAAKSLITESLKLDTPSTEVKTSGDPILDEVLGIIRQQGSVLDGSALDPRGENAVLERSILSKEQVEGESFDRDSVYLTAEQLLRVSRMLQRMNDRGRSPDRDREELIRGMRRQAAKLMIDAISDATYKVHEKTPQASVSP